MDVGQAVIDCLERDSSTSGIETALGMLGDDGESPPPLQIPLALVEDVRRRESL